MKPQTSLNPELENCGKMITTHKGNHLICVKLQGEPLYFAMMSTGKRFLFKHETERGKYLNQKEWDNALATWNGPDGNKAVAEQIPAEKLSVVNDLAVRIANDFTYGMTKDQVTALPKGHMRKFF